MHNTTKLISDMSLAVAHRETYEGQHNDLTISVWYDQAIPVVTVIHPESGVIYEELASDKPSVMAQMLAPWLVST